MWRDYFSDSHMSVLCLSSDRTQLPHGATALRPKACGVGRTSQNAHGARKPPTSSATALLSCLFFFHFCYIFRIIGLINPPPPPTALTAPFIHTLPLSLCNRSRSFFSSACVVGLLPKTVSTETTHTYTCFFFRSMETPPKLPSPALRPPLPTLKKHSSASIAPYIHQDAGEPQQQTQSRDLQWASRDTLPRPHRTAFLHQRRFINLRRAPGDADTGRP